MLHSLCLCWAPKVEQQSRLDAPGGRVSAEPEGRQSMGRSAAEATATEPCCSPASRLPITGLGFVFCPFLQNSS